jgi:hypothetical protein
VAKKDKEEPPLSPPSSKMSNPALEGSHPELESPLKTMVSSGDMRDSDYKISESHEPHSPPKRNDTNNKRGGMRVVVSETK